MGGFVNALVPMRPEVHGYISVALIDRRYPDGMGDLENDVDLLGAWTMRWMGPFTFPGNLARAAQRFRADDVCRAVDEHGALARVLSSYVLGPGGLNRTVLPADYDALVELERVTEVARSLLELSGALAYFNPGGETLFTRTSFDENHNYHRRAGLSPLPLWSGVRLFNLAEHPGWTLMDTVGMEQLDVTDMEACFLTGAFKPAEVDNFLRNATDYVRQKGLIIKDGDTMDGPGNIRWQGLAFDESVAPRNRPVIRWLPLVGPRPPAALVTRTRTDSSA
jgi:hypothetical protein